MLMQSELILIPFIKVYSPLLHIFFHTDCQQNRTAMVDTASLESSPLPGSEHHGIPHPVGGESKPDPMCSGSHARRHQGEYDFAAQVFPYIG